MTGDKRTAIITGGTSGIGAQFARELARSGYDLLLVSVDCEAVVQSTVNDIKSQYPGVEVRAMRQDLAQAGSAKYVIEYCRCEMPPVEVLINNAGIFDFKLLGELSDARLSLYIDLHIRAVTELSLMTADDMIKRNKGYILNMSSMSCWMPMPGIAMYSATKAYIRVFSRAMRLELKGSGVHVMVACPGGIATDLFGLPHRLQLLGVRVGALATPQGFAHKAIKRLFLGRKQYVNGFVNRLAILFIGVMPDGVRKLVRKLLDRS